jgi:hypothetical protein
VGDTYLRGRLTATAGLRIDKQTGHSRPSSVAANPVFPDLLAPLTFSGRGQGVRWTDLSPRLASAYALDSGRRTLLRVSWARYAGQLGAVDAAFDNPNVALSFLAYPWDDLNGDGLAQPGEVRVSDGILFASAVDRTTHRPPTSSTRNTARGTTRNGSPAWNGRCSVASL